MKKPTVFWLCIAATFGLWTFWCALMVGVGEPFSWAPVRTLVRIAVVAIPAVWFLKAYPNDASDRFAMMKNRKIGFAVGCSVATIQLVYLTLTHTLDLTLLPTTAAFWCNYIIFSPLAEELLFRRVAVDYFCERYRNTTGILASAVLFSLIHLPWWVLSGELRGLQLVGLLVTLAVYGLIFGILYKSTGSLWASLIPHWSNNLAATVFV